MNDPRPRRMLPVETSPEQAWGGVSTVTGPATTTVGHRRPPTDTRRAPEVGTEPTERRATMSRRKRNTLLTAHIAVSVALLGDGLALGAITIKAMNDDPAGARVSYEIMSMFSLSFGIPLSMAALVTGVLLGRGTRWGVFRYPWVIAKLGLTIAVILAGALVVGRAQDVLLSESVTSAARTRAEWQALLGTSFQIAALLSAVGLSVFKPGRRRDRARGSS